MQVDIERIRQLCDLERNQKIFVDDMMIEQNALDKLAYIMKTYYSRFHHIVMICDENTYEAAGKKAMEQLPDMGLIILDSTGLHADEHGVQAAEKQLRHFDEIDFLIACGSGTIHDITRYHAYQKKIDFLSIPTAASVDGYVSTMAAMTWKGMKKTFTAVSPVFVLADTTVFSHAPSRLTASGVGDLMGKYTALCDWRIASAITGEYISEPIVNWEYEILEQLVSNLDGLQNHDIKAYENLMYGLLLSGLAMQIITYSRPASGCEHHCSHLWEEAAINEPIDYYHGEKVGVGMILCAEVYKKALERLKTKAYTVQDHVEVETELICQCFQNPVLQEEILKENTPNILQDVNGQMLKEKEAEIIQILEELPTPQEMTQWMKKVNGATNLSEIDLDENLKSLTLRVSPYVRKRITFMRLIKFYSFYEEIIA